MCVLERVCVCCESSLAGVDIVCECPGKHFHSLNGRFMSGAKRSMQPERFSTWLRKWNVSSLGCANDGKVLVAGIIEIKNAGWYASTIPCIDDNPANPAVPMSDRFAREKCQHIYIYIYPFLLLH